MSAEMIGPRPPTHEEWRRRLEEAERVERVALLLVADYARDMIEGESWQVDAARQFLRVHLAKARAAGEHRTACLHSPSVDA